MHGIICLWSGVVADIPDGWALCDGTNGTPNLNAKFVRGTSSQYPPHSQGGTRYHYHTNTVSDEDHDHAAEADENYDTLQDGDPIIDSEPDGQIGRDTQSHYHSVTVQPHTHKHTVTIGVGDHNPNYYTLCYIMKL